MISTKILRRDTGSIFMRIKRNPPIKIVATAGIHISLREKVIYFLVRITTKTTEKEIRAEAPANPLKPKR